MGLGCLQLDVIGVYRALNASSLLFTARAPFPPLWISSELIAASVAIAASIFVLGLAGGGASPAMEWRAGAGVWCYA